MANAARQGIVTLNLKDTAELYRHYMPFLEGGGLFVATTNRTYQLGDEVFVLVVLAAENERMPVTGRVCWITPPGIQGARKAGIGVAFSRTSDCETARTKIESLLAAWGKADQPTMTM